MSGVGERPAAVAFGVLAFDPTSGELTGPAGTARLAPQPAELLALLLGSAGGLVTRDEVKARLWPDGKVEYEQGIAFAVSEVRRGIEAAGGDSTLVETIPKRGFRLQKGSQGPTAHTTEGDSAHGIRAGGAGAIAGQAAERRATLPRLFFGLSSAAAAGVVLFLSLRAAGEPPEPVVAIFPYDVGEAAAAAPLSLSLAEELTAALTLSYRGRVGVIGPAGTTDLAGPADTDGAREQLGACLVLSGSMRPLGDDAFVVFTQLVRTSDRLHVWAARDTLASLEGADSVVTEVTAAVAAALSGC